MRIIQPIITLALISIIYSCGDFKPKDKEKLDDEVSIELTAADIYDGQTVNAFLKSGDLDLVTANNQYFKGIDAFKNEKDLDSSLHYFLQSILQQPTGRAYYELGNVLKQKMKLEPALKAYKMAEQLDYEPFSNLLYQISGIYAMQNDPEKSFQYIEYALQAGYDNLDWIYKDPSFDSIRNDFGFNTAINTGLLGMGDPSTMYWLGFKKQFPNAKFPIQTKISLTNQEMEGLRTISYDYERFVSEMRDYAFSRDVGVGFYYTALVKETDKYTALLYLARDEYMGEFAPSLYRLITFTPNGELIDKKVVAGQNGLTDNLRTAKISEAGNIDIEIYKIAYTKDPEEYGFDENPISSKKKIGTESMFIDPSGKIIRITTGNKNLASL
jgi:tetratricopeptide (TPR) repeat protein